MSEPAELARRFGSPLYLYRLDRVEAACADLRGFLPEPSTLYYSLKANPHPLVVARLRQANCRAEVSSSGELAAALAAGFVGAQCVYTGPGKTGQELEAALAVGVTRFSVESAADLQRLAHLAERHGKTVDCLIRVNVAAASGSTGLRMTGTPSQFGTDFDQLLADRSSYADRPGVRVIGAHFFSSSNARDESGLVAELTASVLAAARLRDEAGYPMSTVDLGGGFAAPYAQPGDRPLYPKLRAPLETALDEHLPGWRDGTVEVAFESGRFLVGDCGTLVATVVDLKRSRGRSFAVLDTGIHHLGGLNGLGRLLPMGATAVTDRADDGDAERVSLVGPLCTPADVLARDTVLGPVHAGDLVTIANTGAYGLTASLLGFLSRPAPVEVVLDGAVVVEASRLTLGRLPVQEVAG